MAPTSTYKEALRDFRSTNVKIARLRRQRKDLSGPPVRELRREARALGFIDSDAIKRYVTAEQARRPSAPTAKTIAIDDKLRRLESLIKIERKRLDLHKIIRAEGASEDLTHTLRRLDRAHGLRAENGVIEDMAWFPTYGNLTNMLLTMTEGQEYYLTLWTIKHGQTVSLGRVIGILNNTDKLDEEDRALQSIYEDLIGHKWSQRDANDEWESHLTGFFNWLEVLSDYNDYKITFTPYKPSNVTDYNKAIVRSSEDVNCLFLELSKRYPTYSKVCMEVARKAREENTETLEELRDLMKQYKLPLRVDLVDFLGDVVYQFKMRGHGNRYLRLGINNGHCYSTDLRIGFPKTIHILEDAKAITSSIISNRTAGNIKIVGGVKLNGATFEGYQTDEGDIFLTSARWQELCAIREQYKLKLSNLELSMKSPLSLRFERWISNSKMLRTRRYIKEAKSAIVEMSRWISPSYDNQNDHYVDRNKAFASVMYETNTEGYPYYKRFGIPTRMELVCVEPVPMELLETKAGIVLAGFKFTDKASEKFRHLLHTHCKHNPEKHVFWPSVLIYYLHTEGFIEELNVKHMVYSNYSTHMDNSCVDSIRELVPMIGKTCQGPQDSTYYVRDPDILNLTIKRLRAEHRACSEVPSLEGLDGGFLSVGPSAQKLEELPDEENDELCAVKTSKRKQYVPVRMSLMAYHLIAQLTVIAKYDDYITRIGPDDVSLTPEGLKLFKKQEEINATIGKWKVKKDHVEYTQRNMASHMQYSTLTPQLEAMCERYVARVDAYTAQSDEKNEEGNTYTAYPYAPCDFNYTNQVSVQRGIAGSGKTHTHISNLMHMAPHTYVVLTPTRYCAKVKLNEYGLGVRNIIHWHGYVKASSPSQWKGKTQAGYATNLIIWDEAYTVDAYTLAFFVTEFKKRGSTVVLVGDPEQLASFSGEDNAIVVESLSDFSFPDLLEDRRSRGHQPTVDLKKAVREASARGRQRGHGECTSEQDAIRVLEQGLDAEHQDWNTMLERWTPKDMVICSTNIMGAKIVTPILQQIHRTKYPDEPTPYTFTKTTVLTEEECYDLDIDMIHYNEEKYEFNNNETVYAMHQPPNTKVAYTTTVHSSIGSSVGENIWIVKHNLSSLWCKGGVYTAVTRIHHIDQLALVTPPSELCSQYKEIKDSLETQIERRLYYHQQYDKEHRVGAYHPDSKLVEQLISIDEVLALCRSTTKCCVCGQDLVYRDYRLTDNVPIWSIDRIDTSRGHVSGNCRIICKPCNVFKKDDSGKQSKYITDRIVSETMRLSRHRGTDWKSHIQDAFAVNMIRKQGHDVDAWMTTAGEGVEEVPWISQEAYKEYIDRQSEEREKERIEYDNQDVVASSSEESNDDDY